MNRYLKTSLKILAWIVGSILGLFLLIVILIQVPAVQNILKNKVVTYLEGKIKTPVKIDKVQIGLPKKIVLKGFYFESQQKDTLLAGDKLAVDVSLFKLLDNQLQINSIDLEGITANVRRNQDSVFNFDYIIDAFASEQSKPQQPQDSTATMKFSIEKINLDKVRIRFDDRISKNDLDFYVNHFDTRIKTFNLDSMSFDVPKIVLNGLNVTLKQGIVEQMAKATDDIVDTVAKTPNFKLKLGEVDVQKVNVAYDNEGTHLNTGLQLGRLYVQFNELDLIKQLVDIKKIELSDTKGGLTFGKFDKKLPKVSADTNTNLPPNQWKVKLAETTVENVAFRFDDENAAPLRRGMDFMHLDMKNLNLDAEDFYYSADTISGKIRQLTVQDRSGLNIQEFRTEFFYGPKAAHLKDLYLQTPQTLIRDQVSLKYPSIDALTNELGSLSIDASIKNSRVGFKDLLLFMPDMASQPPFQGNNHAKLNINGRVIGKVANLRIPELQISGIGNTRLNAHGRITGLPDVEKAYFDLTIKDFRSTARDIGNFVPKGTIPANIQIPPSLMVRGTFKGAINNFQTNLVLGSSFGNARIKALFDQRRKNAERYDADVTIDNFHVGRLIKNDSLGRISLTTKVSGTGLDPKTANAKLSGLLKKAEYNRYTYRNLKLDGNIRNGLFQAMANMNDPNLDFDLKASGNFKGKYPSIKLNTQIDSANLGELNLYAGSLRIRGKVEADLETADPDYLNGTVSLNNLLIAQEADKFLLDSINLVARATADSTSLDLTAPFMDASIKGKYELTQVGTALSNSIAKYYDTSQGIEREAIEPQQFSFHADIYNHPALLKLVPQIKRLEPIAISGRYNSEGDSIRMTGRIPKLVFGSNTISNANLNVNTQNDVLNYSLVIDEVSNPQLVLPHTELTGNVQNNLLAYRLQIRDRQDKERYLIAGNMKALESQTEFRLELEGLRLNYEPWTIAEDNLIAFGESGLYANNFVLSNNSQSIKIQSQSTAANSPLDIDFSQFKIETITSMVEKDSLLLGGTINGDVNLTNLNAEPLFTSDLTIQNFNFRADTLGDISLKVNNQQGNAFAANVAITGQGNQVNLDGIYRTDNSSFDMDLRMQRLNMKSIQGFTMGNLSESSGYLTGNFKITGNVDAPQVRGDLQFNDAAFRVVPLGSYYKVGNERISFNAEGIVFDRFALVDSANNELSINGMVYTQTYTDYRFNLEVRADNFRAMNSTAKDNELYYGQLFFDTRLRIRGDLDQPVVDGSLKLNKDTRLTIVLPQSDPGIADREGIVEFIDQDNPQLAETFSIPDSLNNSELTGLDVSVNIEIDPEAELTMIIDKGNGDFVRLKGEADLTGGIDPSGKMTLTGRYELKEGSYEMSFNFLRRKFSIKEGSYINWTGEPMSADVSLTAIYETETAPIDLVGDQLGEASQAVRNTYKQELPFQVLLMMEGELLKPEISFDIQLPDGNYNVSQDIVDASQTRLQQLRQQPSELNKQVFAVLLLNRFIGENPFASEAGSGGVESLARQSVSKILSEQLNNLAGDLIEGVELNFDLESTDDYTTGQRENRTDLNVGVSKRLLNDRLKVTVGSNFGLEGPQQANRQTNNIAGDVAIDYQLSKDGRYRLRAYRKNQYQMAIQGQVVETGLGFILTMDYNKFKEIFDKSRKRRDRKTETLEN